MRVLIIEDDRELSQVMKAGLEKSGFTADVANSGADGEEKAYATPYDAILLDLNLPDKDGMEILSFLRQSQVATPVIIITARDEITQRALGLDTGADDYIIKPFDFVELRARIRAVVRRSFGRTNPEISIGKLVLNPQTRKVHFDGTEIALSAKEFDILECLSSRSPAVVSSEEIAEHVYDDQFDPFSSVLRVHLANLRKKLAAAGAEKLLQNVKGKGYCICP
jgi:two-component system response regulator QseB